MFLRFTTILIVFTFCSEMYAQDKTTVLDYSIKEETVSDTNFRSLDGGKVKDTQKENTNKIFLSSTHHFSVATPALKKETYYHFDEEYITTIENNAITNQVPIYHILDYRIAEYENRIFLSELLSAGGNGNSMGDSITLQTLFGIEPHPNEKSPIKAKLKKNVHSFTYQKRNIATITYSKHKISAQAQLAFEKYLTYCLKLHPFVQKTILNHGYFPEHIHYEIRNVGQNIVCDYSLKEVNQVDHHNFNPNVKTTPWNIDPEGMEGRIDSIYRIVTTQPVPLMDSTTCFPLVDSLVAKGEKAEAFLILFEYLLQTGVQPSKKMGEISKDYEEGSPLHVLLYVINTPTSEEDAKQKIAYLDQFDTTQFEHGHIALIFAANFITQIDDYEALLRFNKVIEKSPFITGVYVDLGRLLAGRYDHESAWKCFDIAIKLTKEMPLTSVVQIRKDKLKSQYPNYFSNNK